jgi:hypothetical protein
MQANASPWTEISCSGAHPAANGQNDTRVHWAVRRWVSDVRGTVIVRGTLWNYNTSGGDGVVGRVFHNDDEIYSTTSSGQAVPIYVPVTVAVGDTLDFAMDADAAGRLEDKGLDAISDTADNATFVVAITQASGGGGAFVRGDANVDGALDIADPIQTLAHLFASGPMLCKDAADANDDGAVDIADPIMHLAQLFAGGPNPPPPFGRCGPDPTDDALDCASFPPCAR